MSLYKYPRKAAVEYQCNVHEFIGLGEGLKLTALEIYHIKVKYPEVEEWYESLPAERRRLIDEYLEKMYGDETDHQTEELRRAICLN